MISILMPIKNGEAFIEPCIQSIRGQTVQDWQLIIVDDHSTDEGINLIKNFTGQDDRIRVVKNRGVGILPALQTAQTLMDGQYVTRMDADDLMPPDKLGSFRRHLDTATDKTVVTGKCVYFSETDVSPGYRSYENWLNRVVDRQSFYSEIYRECTIASPNWMMKTDDFLAMDGFSRIDYPEDYDMVFQLRQNGFNVVGIDQVTHKWREHPGRTSRHQAVYQQKSFFNLKLKYFLANETYDKKGLSLWGTAKKGKIVARTLMDNQRPFTWIDWKHEKYSGGIYGQPIYPLDQFHQIESPLVINTVWPPANQKRVMDDFIQANQLILGSNYFEF